MLDDRRRSANAMRPWTESLRLTISAGSPLGGSSTGSDKHALRLGSSISFSSLMVGVFKCFCLDSSGVFGCTDVVVSSGCVELGLRLVLVMDTNLFATARESGFLSPSLGLLRSIVDF